MRALAPAPGTTSSYRGESGFSMLERGGEHWDALQNPPQHPDNAFVNHASYYHQDREVDKVDFKLKPPLHQQQGHGAALQRGGGDPPRGAGGRHHHELEAGPLRTISGQDGAGEGGERQGGRHRTRS